VEFPAVVVLGGPTGAGKSTLLNSLLRQDVSEADVVRPTTRTPVLAVNPHDAEDMRLHPIAAAVETVEHRAVPRGVVLVDTPDLDSVVTDNRVLAAQLVEVADLWIFVTTATRYGDALPWTTLTAARDRGVTVAVVLNRVGGGALADVRADLLDRLAAEDLGDVPLFVLPDLGPHAGRLPVPTVAEFARWLTLLAESAASQRVASRTIRGGWAALREDVGRLAGAVEAQSAAAAALTAVTTTAVARHADAARTAVAAGEGAGGSPLATWLSHTAPAGALGPLAGGPRRFSSRPKAVEERTGAAAEVGRATLGSIRLLIADAAGSAERDVRGAWVAGDLGGAVLLDRVDRPAVAGSRAARIAAAVEDWLAEIERDLVANPLVAGERAGRLLQPRGWAGLVAAAAAGVLGAASVIDDVLGVGGSAVRANARAGLAARAADVVTAEREPFLAVLAGEADGAAVGAALRRRVDDLGVTAE
jgi:energy-coupling factor transporter ATP-binding protein EcfA2